MNTKYTTKQVNKIQVREHRFIMEQYLGRKLKSSELVHHKNKNRYDNRLENLVLTTRSEHKRLHPEIGKEHRFKQKHLVDEKKLRKLYIEELLSIRKIAKMWGISQSRLLFYKNKYGIKRPEIKCRLCGKKANYIRDRLCCSCYQREWYRRNKKHHN